MTDHPIPTPQPSDAEAAIWAARKARAKRWRDTDLTDYPIVSLEEETPETLAAEPPTVEERKRRRNP